MYRRVLATVDEGVWADRNTLTVAGWCAFRLNQLTWAAALLGRTTPGERELPEARLDLGLVLLASRRPRAALDEYEGAIDLLRKHADPARARAMLDSAWDDLLQARKEGRLTRTASGGGAVAMLRTRSAGSRTGVNPSRTMIPLMSGRNRAARSGEPFRSASSRIDGKVVGAGMAAPRPTPGPPACRS